LSQLGRFDVWFGGRRFGGGDGDGLVAVWAAGKGDDRDDRDGESGKGGGDEPPAFGARLWLGF
jgi:hypothetical protein